MTKVRLLYIVNSLGIIKDYSQKWAHNDLLLHPGNFQNT